MGGGRWNSLNEGDPSRFFFFMVGWYISFISLLPLPTMQYAYFNTFRKFETDASKRIIQTTLLNLILCFLDETRKTNPGH